MNSPLKFQYSNITLRDMVTRSPPPSSLSEKIQHQGSMKNIYAQSPAPNYHLGPTTVSEKVFGNVCAYAANTHSGLSKKINEDRLSIFLKIQRPVGRTELEWPECSYFGLFDGQGGKGCASYLRDHLHTYVTRDPSFPSDPKTALTRGFAEAEKAFFQASLETQDGSGSCALVVLLVNGQCFVANAGNSRALMCGENGKRLLIMSKDHVPEEPGERNRIMQAGGHLYMGTDGKYRVSPGGLAVSRSLGHLSVKFGQKGLLASNPEVKVVEMWDQVDYILMATQGVFNKLDNTDLVLCVKRVLKNRFNSLGPLSAAVVEEVMNETFRRYASDNLTVLFIALPGLLRMIN